MVAPSKLDLLGAFGVYYALAVPCLFWKLNSSYRGAPSADAGVTWDASGRLTIKNPFVNLTWQLSTWNRIKLSLLGPVLLPVRLTCITATVGALVLLGKLTMLGVKDPNSALPRWRLLLRSPVRPLTRLLFWHWGFYYIQTKGKLDPDARLIIANHTGFLEPAFLCAVSGGSPVSRKENASIPLFGALVRALQCVFVDRADPESRKNVAREIVRRTTDRSFPPVVIFPEGTCTNTNAVITFKLGAFAPFEAVQPVAIEFPFANVDPSFVNAGPSLGQLMLRLLCSVYTNMRVTFLPLRRMDSSARGTPGEAAYLRDFANGCRRQIAGALNGGRGVPLTEQRVSYEDVQLQVMAERKLHSKVLNKEAGETELRSLRKLVDIDVGTAKQYLASFSSMDGTHDGRVTLRDFATGLGFTREVPPQVRALFALLDTDDTGTLDFREYLTGLAIINERGKHKTRDALRLAFRVFANGEDGASIEEAQFKSILRRVLTEQDDASLSQLFKEADADADGRVTCDEFVEFACSPGHAEFLPLFRSKYFGDTQEAEGKKAS